MGKRWHVSTNHFQISRDRYIALYGDEPVAAGRLAAIERALGLTLPDSLQQVASYYRGGCLGGISHHSIETARTATNVTNETLRLRSAINLPHRYVVLAEPPESLIVLDCQSGAVIWCGAQDVYRLDDLKTTLSPMDVWPDYLDFFAFLLDEEQAARDRQ